MKTLENGDYRIDAARLEALVSSMLAKVGVPGDDAALVARSLIGADLRGMNSHGILRLPIYIDRLRDGGFKPDRQGKVVRETKGTVLIDGEDGLGAALSCRAMDAAIGRARECGIGAAGLFNSNHNGEGAFYAQRAIAADMIGIATTTGSPIMPAWGGKTKITGPLPITVGVPAGQELPVLLDAALGMSSRGKILYYAEKKIPLPDGWLVDADGRPTNDGEHVRQGGWILPIGGHKGWGLIAIMEILAGVLTGGALGQDIAELFGDTSKAQKNGQFFIAIDVEAFMGIDAFKARMDDYIRMVKASELADGFEEIVMPGEIEYRKERDQRANGLTLGRNVVDAMLKKAEEIGVPVEL